MASSDRHHNATGGIDTEKFVDCAAVEALDDGQQEAAREGLEIFLTEYRERHPTAAVPDNPTTTAVVEGLVATIKQADPNGPATYVGERRLDRTREKEVIVVAIHNVVVEEYGVLATGKTIAEHNPECPADDRVIEAAYAESVGPDQEIATMIADGELGESNVETYAFPESRLVAVEDDEKDER